MSETFGDHHCGVRAMLQINGLIIFNMRAGIKKYCVATNIFFFVCTSLKDFVHVIQAKTRTEFSFHFDSLICLILFDIIIQLEIFLL